MPRQLSQYMDKSLRIPATPETCYTWFPCSEAFLNNPEKQAQYLKKYPSMPSQLFKERKRIISVCHIRITVMILFVNSVYLLYSD